MKVILKYQYIISKRKEKILASSIAQQVYVQAKLRQSNWSRSPNWLIWWSNCFLIDIFDPKSWNQNQMSRHNRWKPVQIQPKWSNLIGFNWKEIKNDRFISKIKLYRLFYINQQFWSFNCCFQYFQSFNWLKFIFKSKIDQNWSILIKIRSKLYQNCDCRLNHCLKIGSVS